MAPRRNNGAHHASVVEMHNLLGMDPDSLDAVPNGSPGANSDPTSALRCCVPTGECLKAGALDLGLISPDDIRECVRVVCNNEHCTAGQFMHRECFETWEQGVLSYLKSIGRARSWSERQRQQNLWTKKGYDLVFKACSCKCGRGHLKKDLDWVPPAAPGTFGRNDDEASKKKKKRNRNQKPILLISTGTSNAYHPNSQINGNGILATQEIRGRTGSLSSSNGSTSPPASASSELSVSPIHNGNSGGKKQKSKIEIHSERVRAGSGCNGIFSRRLDFSSFNLLPKTRLNSYQIKMEDEGNHGNDETRLFILSSLASQQRSRVACILCEEPMFVFDRYPLVDGTFFLSPKQHAKGCIEVKYEGRTQYLTSVCMGCLEGISSDRIIRCRFCGQKWDGSSLVLGTMYSYDIFAAMPCCTERLKCNNCFKLLLHPNQRLNFFSDYSHLVSCPYCTSHDTHFVKPLAYCYTKQPLQVFQQWP
ncbi:headcase protein [Phlebotomus papatasi]|uniref:headcase protein n=1 Tax=Phlebotomus papatasi TaxID=29031 RepID=UPI0024836B16|nr:headcase protein [Phlebotomus papatasi]